MRSPADRFILVFIALFQLGVSSLLLLIQFVAYGGGFQPVSTPFRLFGFINSLFLFTARAVPRFGSFLWQLIFVIWVLALFSRSALSSAAVLSGSDQFFLAICLLMFVSLVYLSASLKQELAKRGWSWSAWMGWK